MLYNVRCGRLQALSACNMNEAAKKNLSMDGARDPSRMQNTILGQPLADEHLISLSFPKFHLKEV